VAIVSAHTGHFSEAPWFAVLLHSSWVVPQRSVAKGRESVTAGGVMRMGGNMVPRTTACSRCAPLAGRPASYLARQLDDLHRETRTGRPAALMRVVVANLTEQHEVAITASLASLPPVKTSRPLP